MKSPKNQRIIQIDITNACTHECSNCTRFCGHHEKPFFMSFETFKRAVDSMDGYMGTIGVMGGEPTLHPEFERFVNYLNDHLPEAFKKEKNNFVYPQKDFMKAMHDQELENTIGYPYETGVRECVLGPGLWSAMVGTYKKHYEIIQDVFRIQAVNDHGNPSYHSPILLTRKEMGIPDDEWIKLRDNCWMQNVWSATITPKGCFFCEVAGALDMLLDGPGGWPIEKGWWKRTPDQFGDQLHWCEVCGVALQTYSRNANEEIDDISPYYYEKLKDTGSRKIREGRYNIIEFDGKGGITESCKAQIHLKESYMSDGYSSRFSTKSILYTTGIDAVVVMDKSDACNSSMIDGYRKLFDKVHVIISSEAQKKQISDLDIVIDCSERSLGWGIYKAIENLGTEKEIVILSAGTVFSDVFVNELKELIINPGTLHVKSTKEAYKNKWFELKVNGFCVMLSGRALSLRQMGVDGLISLENIDDLQKKWIPEKVVRFDESMVYEGPDNRIKKGGRYILYGTGGQCGKAEKFVEEGGGIIVDYCNSFPENQGKEFHGKIIISPEELCKRDDYDKVLITSLFHYNEIKLNLNRLGIYDEKIVLVEKL